MNASDTANARAYLAEHERRLQKAFSRLHIIAIVDAPELAGPCTRCSVPAVVAIETDGEYSASGYLSCKRHLPWALSDACGYDLAEDAGAAARARRMPVRR